MPKPDTINKKEKKTKVPILATYIKTLHLLKNNRVKYVICLIFDIVMTAVCFNTYQAFMLKDIVNASLDRDISLLYRGVVIGAVTLTAGIVVLPVIKMLKDKYVIETGKNLRVLVYQKLLQLPMRNFDSSHSADYLFQMSQSIKVDRVFNSFNNLFFSLIYGGIAIVSMLILDWKIGLIIIMLDIVQMLVSAVFIRPVQKAAQAKMQAENDLMKKTTDAINSVKSTKIFGIEKLILNQYQTSNAVFVKKSFKSLLIHMFHNGLSNFYSNIKYFGLLAYGLFMVLNNTLDIGIIVAMLRLQNDSSYMFSSIGSLIIGLQEPLVNISKIFDFLDIQTDDSEIEAKTADIQEADCLVDFQNVSFQYNPTASTVKNISFSLRSKEKIAFVGPSGGGKSTIVKLMLGLYPLNEGCIKINGIELDPKNRALVQSYFAYVPQNAYLFDETIEENILYGNPEASMEEVQKAAALAKVDQFIHQFPEGYQTKVGEGGTRLSGGQKQRIAIARAILRNAPIMVLDEATSSLDSDTEKYIQDAMNEAIMNKASVMIAHRFSTVVNADMIYFVKDGEIIEQGTHEQLLAKHSEYESLYNNSIQIKD